MLRLKNAFLFFLVRILTLNPPPVSYFSFCGSGSAPAVAPVGAS